MQRERERERERPDRYPLCLAACVALVACLRLCLALLFPEQIPLGWKIERVALGTLLDCGPLFVFSLAALFWKTRLLNILSAFWLLIILVWNAANCFLIHTARRIIDYDILLQVLPEARHALDALPEYGIVVVVAGAAGAAALTAWLVRSQRRFALRRSKRVPAVMLLLLIAMSALATGYYCATRYDMDRRRGWMSIPAWKSAWEIWYDRQESRSAPVGPPREALAADRQAMAALGLQDKSSGTPYLSQYHSCGCESLNLEFSQVPMALFPARATPHLTLWRGGALACNFYTSAAPTARARTPCWLPGSVMTTTRERAQSVHVVGARRVYSATIERGVRVAGDTSSTAAGQLLRAPQSEYIVSASILQDKVRDINEKWGIESGYLFEDALEIPACGLAA